MKKIGIIGTQQNEIFGVPTKYMEWASQFGELIILSPQNNMQENLDLLILPGGGDINPMTYGKTPFYNLGRSNPYLEYFDKEILPKYIENKTPIFGICRGMQAINIAFKGTLKNINGHPTNYSGDRKEKKHYMHSLNKPNELIAINSLHHQIIDRIGTNILPIAKHCDDKGKEKQTIEAITHKELPIAGVQYHPEEINDKFAIELVNELLKI
jgi:putative glutamine amidotransferase